jgi:hypothetical protein
MSAKGFEKQTKFWPSRPSACALLLGAIMILGSTWAWAGPPFLTDDPETVEPGHAEFYIGSQFQKDKAGNKAGTGPHFEFNYGLVEDVQLHMIAPLAWNKPSGQSSQYGLGDLEFGVKYRFIHETDNIPQVGFFPIVDLPTGDDDKGLGGGETKLFLPLWFQKSWGAWTSYAGGGYWINPGADRQNYWFTGWVLQRRLNEHLSLGAELYYATADVVDAQDRFGFNVGTIVDLTDEHHILLSAGRDIQGENDLIMYLAYQFTFGPHEDKK